MEDEPRELASPVCYLKVFEVLIFDEAEPLMTIRIKHAYETPSPRNGARFLVDRLWPRGVKQESLALTAWLKDIAPGNKLRSWFGHDVSKWTEFRRRYRAELKSQPEALRPLREALKQGPVTLVYSARDEKHNQAVVLRAFLRKPPASPRGRHVRRGVD